MLFFTGQVAGGVCKLCLQFRLPGLGPGFLALQRIPVDGEAMEHGRAGSLFVAQGLELSGRFGLEAQGLGFGSRLLGHGFESVLKRQLVGLDLGASRDPLQMVKQRLHLMDSGRDVAIALGLAGLAPRRLELRIQLADQIREAREIAFRRLQAQFGLMAAAVKPGDAGGIFQDAPPLERGRAHDLADTALLHEGR